MCVAKLRQSYQNEPYHKLRTCPLHFYYFRNKSVYCTEMYVYCIDTFYILHIQHIYTLHVCMTTSGYSHTLYRMRLSIL